VAGDEDDQSNGVDNGYGEQGLGLQDDRDFEQLLDHIKRDRGFDFTGYKRPSLMRRVAARMNAVGCENFADYLDVLQVDPQEYTNLFDALLINVTGFFRDPAAWEVLSTEVVPGLLAHKPSPEPIRVWSAGCASGEEAYTLAIVLAEHLGPEEMRRRVTIYGTDIDEVALMVGRHAAYGPNAVSGVPDALRERYFERSGTGYSFRNDLRQTVIFGRHDLVHAAPISHIDLLACRNTVMYLNSETQARVMARLHFALEDHGILFLGRAEMLLAHSHLFAAVDPKQRIFVKVTDDNLRDRRAVTSDGGGFEPVESPVDYRPVRELAAEGVSAAVVVVDRSGAVVTANSAARRLFGLNSDDIGRPFHDLEMSYRPTELRSALEQVDKEQRPLTLEQVYWPEGPDMVNCLDIHVVPVSDPAGTPLGVALTFVDVSLSRRLQEELEHSKRDLETAYEALQSANEELETMTAELRSTNEELQTINDELRMRTGELDEVNDFLESMLISQRGGLVVIDRDLRISVWNDRSAELWGVRTDEAPGQHFLNLDIGLPVEDLRSAIKSLLAGESGAETVTLAATNRRGKEFQCQVTLSPLINRARSIRGVILLMEELGA
jgi:two-component system CheB/CheR fusion protein